VGCKNELTRVQIEVSMDGERILLRLYRTLRQALGDQQWWPADSAFEVMVGAVLTQNTNWSSVEKAIHDLKRHSVLSPSAIATAPLDELMDLVRPAGYFRLKSRRLKRLARWVEENVGDDVAGFASVSTDVLREQLLAIRGIGPETADSILLYALQRPVFVVDSYTKRVLTRHCLAGPEFSYYDLQTFLQESLPRDLDLYKDFHAQFVGVGKRFCRKRPLCDHCPVLPLLGSPVMDDG